MTRSTSPRITLEPLHFSAIVRPDWQSVLLRSGLATQALDDCSEGFLGHFLELRAGAERQAEPVSPFERQAWDLVIDAINASLVGYFRLVAG
jgi:hypothetical protein